ncbi:hypothetical protein Tco_0533804 [Tanacetum coccineum]
MHKAKVEEPLGNTTLSVMKLYAWLINSFGNFHELDYNVLVKLQECWWKINAHEVARFTRLESYGHRPYADFKTEKARVPYLEINNIFGRNYDTSLSSQTLHTAYRTPLDMAYRCVWTLSVYRSAEEVRRRSKKGKILSELMKR